MIKIALTGHTSGLGSVMFDVLTNKNYKVIGFSKSSGCDIRDYSQSGSMIEQVKDFDWFINCAHPDYCQSQILYRLIANGFTGKILNIGSPVVHQNPNWTDVGLLEYVTQKTALWHAYTTLNRFYPEKVLMWEPDHTTDRDYVINSLNRVGL